MRLALTNAALIDCINPGVQAPATVVIDNGRISQISTDKVARSPSECVEIDLKGAYLMPGLWDVHIHPDYFPFGEMPLVEQVTLFGRRLMDALTEAGITGVRCAGAHSFLDVAWKRAFDSGPYVGPRVYASGHFLTTTAGHFLHFGACA